MAERHDERTEEQRSASRRVWIVVGILVLLAVCVMVLAGTAAVGLLIMRGDNTADGGSWMEPTEVRMHREFSVDEPARLEVDSFAGRIEVVAGDDDQIRVTAVKRVRGLQNQNQISVEMTQSGDAVRVEVKRRAVVNNASVDITVEVPQHTTLDLHTNAGSLAVKGISADQTLRTNAGSIEMNDCEGQVDAKTNAGSIKAKGMAGEVDLESNAGSVDYEGSPEGSCRFDSSAGGIYLELPDDLDAEIDLSSSAGSVTVDWPVKGQVEKDRVRGTIGDGGDVEIEAHAGAGRIRLMRR